MRYRHVQGVLLIAGLLLSPAVGAASFVEDSVAAFGTFGGVEYVTHTGRFEGSTALGAFRVPYEIVTPADPSAGTATLLIEPPHFVNRTAARDGILGREFLFDRGIRHGSVGFGLNGRNILEPGATDLILGGNPVVPPVMINLAATVDIEILIQFAEALATDPFATALLGEIERRYAFGVSQTATVMLELLHRPGGVGLFDMTLLHLALWTPPFQFPGVFAALDATGGVFSPLEGVGRVLFVASEGDQVVSASEQFRAAVGEPDYRIYEVAGSSHQVTFLNPLDHWPITRAIFVRADEWVRWGIDPPASRLIQAAAGGGADPVYGFPTGIARDGDLNALGGVRLPDLEVGRAQFIASDFSIGLPITLPGLIGGMIDLACEPAAGSMDGPRFENHGDYAGRFVTQTNALRNAGFLLDADAEALKQQAAESDVGMPGTCPGVAKEIRFRR